MAKTKASVRYKIEEKRRHVIIIAIILFFLGFIMIIAGTYAYYQTTATNTVGGTVLSWEFKANNSVTTFSNITLVPTQTSSTLNSTMAPGTSGSFTINLSTTISANYTITFSDFQNRPTNLKFYSDSSFQTETDITASGYSITGSLGNNGTGSKTIYWKWPANFGDSSSVAVDNAAADKNFKFNVSVVGRQT